jgi:hypothetical protein
VFKRGTLREGWFTAFLQVSPVQRMPACSHTGTPSIAFDGFLHFTLFDYVGIGLFDESANACERLAPPIAGRLESRIDQPRGRIFHLLIRSALRRAFRFRSRYLSLVHPCEEIFELVEPFLPETRHLAGPVDQRARALCCAL